MAEQVLNEETGKVETVKEEKKGFGFLPGKKAKPAEQETIEVNNPEPIRQVQQQASQLTMDDLVKLAYANLTVEQMLGLIKLKHDAALIEVERAKQLIYSQALQTKV